MTVTAVLGSLARPRISATALGIVAAVIALAGSWIPSLWGDEVASAMSARRSPASLALMARHVDAVHTAYYAALHLWIHVAGSSPFALRLPSALAVGAATGAVVMIASTAKNPATGIVAGLICAVLPRITYIGEEARSYALSAALAGWATVALLAALRRTSARAPWVVYTVLIALGIWFFVDVGLMILAHGIALILSRTTRRNGRAFLLAAGIAVTAASPVIVAGILQRDQIAYLSTRQEISVDSTLVSMWFGQPQVAVVGWALLIAGVVRGVLLVVRGRSIRLDLADTALVVGVAWLVLPTALLIGTSPLLAAFTARYLAFCAPAVAVVSALGLASTARLTPRLPLVGAALFALLAAPAWVSQRTSFAKNNSDWAEIGAYVAAHAKKGDAVIYDDSTRPSRRPRLSSHGYPGDFAGLRNPTLGTPYTRSTTWHDIPITVGSAVARGRFDAVDRVWAIEYSDGSTSDRYGIPDLERIGFSVESTHRTWRGSIVELERPRP